MPFPESASHLKYWIASSKEALEKQRLRANEDARSEVAASIGAKQEVLTADAERGLVAYMVRQLLSICKEKRLSYAVTSTAVTYFVRFYLRRSVMAHDPRKVLFTCALLAMKAEDVANQTSMKSFLDGLEGSITVGEIVNLELPVLDTLDFQLLVLHMRTPLQHVSSEFFNRKRTGKSPAEVESLSQRLGTILSNAESLGLRLHVTDVPLMYTPGQIASALFLHCAAAIIDSDEELMKYLYRKSAKHYGSICDAIVPIRTAILALEAEEEAGTARQSQQEEAFKAMKILERINRRRAKKSRNVAEDTSDRKRRLEASQGEDDQKSKRIPREDAESNLTGGDPASAKPSPPSAEDQPMGSQEEQVVEEYLSGQPTKG